MLYSASHRFLFVGVNKTASASIRKALLPYCVRSASSQFRRLLSHLPVRENPLKANLPLHQTAAWARRKFPKAVFEGCFKFAFVRNPYDWAVSYYIFLKTDPNHHRNKMVADLSFIEFLKWQQRRRHLPMQWHTIADQNDTVLLDFVGHFETLEADFKTVLDRLGIEGVSLMHRHKGDRRSYQDYYDDVSRDLVERIWAKDIEKLGYEF